MTWYRIFGFLAFVIVPLCFGPACPEGAIAQEPADGVTRLDHLLQAAANLEKAGRVDLAGEVYAQIAGESEADRNRLADAKLEQIRRLEAEVSRLRLSSAGGGQISVQVKVIDLALEKLQASGLGLVSIRNLLDSNTGSAVLDDDGQISEFMELLRREGLVQVVAEPMLVTSDGREATLAIGSASAPVSHAGRNDANPSSAPPVGLRFTCTPTITESGKLSLDIHLLRTLPADRSRTGTEASDPQPVRSVEINTKVELGSGETLVLPGQRQSAGNQGTTAVLLLITAKIVKS